MSQKTINNAMTVKMFILEYTYFSLKFKISMIILYLLHNETYTLTSVKIIYQYLLLLS